jgi:hypothetical protein
VNPSSKIIIRQREGHRNVLTVGLDTRACRRQIAGDYASELGEDRGEVESLLAQLVRTARTETASASDGSTEDEPLSELFQRTYQVCQGTAKRCRSLAASRPTQDMLIRVALENFARQLDAQAAQILTWRSELNGRIAPSRKAKMRSDCTKWLRMDV